MTTKGETNRRGIFNPFAYVYSKIRKRHHYGEYAPQKHLFEKYRITQQNDYEGDKNAI